MKLFLIEIFVITSLILSSCTENIADNSQIYVGAEAGPVDVTLALDNNGDVSVSGGLTPKFKVGLGVVELKIGIQKTLELMKSTDYTLFVIWEDDNGEIQREEYEIGKEFRVSFTQNERIQEIQGDNNCIIVVVQKQKLEVNSFTPPNGPEKQVEPTDIKEERLPEISNAGTPVEVIQDYYETINSGDYQKAWGMLSQNFKNTYNASGYQPYADWWSSVREVKILSTTIETQNKSDASLLVEIEYYYQNGEIDTYDLMEFKLKVNDSGNGWLINDATLIKGYR